MHATTAYQRAPIEIACDESGWAGENLLDGSTDVFAHASVRMSPEHASGIIDEARRRIRSPATEYKATHLLRAKHRRVLEWFLSTDGPLHDRASVYLVDKRFLVVRALIDLVADPSGSRFVESDSSAARGLHADGQRTFGRERWTRLLVDVQQQIRDSRPLRAAAGPVLDPLPAAIARSAHRWSGAGAVSIVHDRQTTLAGERLAYILDAAGGTIADIRFAAAHTDARIQVADFLAGTARAIASDELNGRGDAVLTNLVRPYADPASIWADEQSAARLFD